MVQSQYRKVYKRWLLYFWSWKDEQRAKKTQAEENDGGNEYVLHDNDMEQEIFWKKQNIEIISVCEPLKVLKYTS